ncbi:hypothetical protein HKD37_05G012924 [Glycine soja]
MNKEVISIGRVTQEVFERIAATSIRTEPAFESIAATTTRLNQAPKNHQRTPFIICRIMATDPTSPPQSDGQSEATSKRSRTTTRLRTLTLRTVDQPRPAVYVDPATGRASGPMREKFHSYLGVVAREKVPIIHNNWKDVPETLKEIVWNDILDSLEEQVTQGSFVPHGRQDILNTAIGRPDHGGRVRAAGSGVTITQYYGRASRTCSSSSTSISQQQLDEVVARLREDMTGQIREELRTQIKEELRTQLEEENKRSLEIMTNALKEAIKKELSNKGSQEALQIQPDIQQLGARVSTQGSNAVTNAQASQEHDADAIPLMGLFVQRNDGTQRLVAMGKIMEGDSIIHTVAYADDVVRVSVETVIDPEAEVPYATSEIQYVKQAVNTFVAWPTHLVKAVLDEHPQRIPHNEDAHVPKPANVNADDPLRELMKYSFDLYDKPLQITFDGRFLGIVDASTSIFITYSDVIEIIAGDKSLNISVIQLWLMYIHEWSQIFSQGFMYAFLEPQSLVCSKDRRSECEQYLERWLKESDREVYIGPYFHHVMTKLKKTLSPETKAVAPKWIEVKSHVQTGCYECGYYIMHWIWNIIASDIKSDWSMMILSFDLAFALIPLLKFSSSKVTSSTSIEEPYLPTTTGAPATVVETSNNNDGVHTTDVDILPNNVGGEPATDVDRKQNKYGLPRLASDSPEPPNNFMVKKPTRLGELIASTLSFRLPGRAPARLGELQLPQSDPLPINRRPRGVLKGSKVQKVRELREERKKRK